MFKVPGLKFEDLELRYSQGERSVATICSFPDFYLNFCIFVRDV